MDGAVRLYTYDPSVVCVRCPPVCVLYGESGGGLVRV